MLEDTITVPIAHSETALPFHPAVRDGMSGRGSHGYPDC